MAIELQNKTNVNAPDSDFPYGDVRDKTPTVAGTKYDRNTMSDYFQFFHKMMDEAGITYNNVLDNDYSGFQLYEAFRKLTRPYKVYSARVGYSGGSMNVIEFEPISELPIVWAKSATGVFQGTLTGIFIVGKTWVDCSNFDAYGNDGRIGRVDNNIIEITSYASGVASDAPMTEGVFVEIKVYD